MRNAVVIAGRLVGPRQVELDEPVSSLGARVDVIKKVLNVPGGAE